MPYILTNAQEDSWRYGLQITAKVGSPGSKIVVHGTGRQSLNFSVSLLTGIPWDKPGKPSGGIIRVRCRWMDPDFLLNTSDVVRVTGMLIKAGTDLGLLVNKCEVLARFVKKADLKNRS